MSKMTFQGILESAEDQKSPPRAPEAACYAIWLRKDGVEGCLGYHSHCT